MSTYSIYRFFEKHPKQLISEGLTLEEAQEHCSDPESSWKTATMKAAILRTEINGPWFDGFAEE